MTRQHDQGEYSKDRAYRHVHTVEAGRYQAERVLLSPFDAAARVSGQPPEPSRTGRWRLRSRKDQSKLPRWECLLGIAGQGPGDRTRSVEAMTARASAWRRVVICKAPFLSLQVFRYSNGAFLGNPRRG
jgi:hypothetical protein